MLQIFNSLSRKKEVFEPLNDKQVSMYVCGITVYDLCHIGHARTMIIFDMVNRYLRFLEYNVRFVRNITDIDDKIIQRAIENNETIQALTNRMIKAMQEDFAELGLLKPEFEPKATEHIQKIIGFIRGLADKGIAYKGENGDIFFDVSKFENYGALANRDLESMRAGARVEVVESKDDPLDFVLWKKAKPNEPSWDSPWGRGRPGWHIECSAMVNDCLSEQIDIHGGGMDLKFPHHENEIAQSESFTGKPLARYWMHSGFLQINHEKMSKSLNNFFSIRDVLTQYSPEVLRYFMLSAHYRSPLNYSEVGLKQAEQAMESFYIALRALPVVPVESESEYEKRFIEAMNDDFNTPQAYAVLFELLKEVNRFALTDIAEAARLAAILRKLANILGLLKLPPEIFLQKNVSKDEMVRIDQLIEQRNVARQQKDWKEADRIRDLLLAEGVLLEDKEGKTTWRKN